MSWKNIANGKKTYFYGINCKINLKVGKHNDVKYKK